MAEHRERIIISASRKFREKGFDGVSVTDLMKEARLTHGGFYNHFDSKEELMSLAVERAFDETVARWNGFLSGIHPGRSKRLLTSTSAAVT